MAGIISYGAYIPYYRMSRNVMQSAMGWLAAPPLPGEKAIANFDEDSVSMGVAASIDCLADIKRENMDAIYFATTTQPYLLRQNSGIIAAALDSRPEVRTVDFTGSTKAGTSALLSAWDAIKGGTLNNVLVCASDCRLTKPGSAWDYTYGDGAAAFLVGEGEAIATVEGSHSISYDFVDRRRISGEKFEHTWEDRWVRDIGFSRFIPEVIAGLMKKLNLSAKDLAKVVYSCPYSREHAALVKGLGFAPEQIQDPLLATVGDTGSAHALMMLVAALEQAKAGDKIIVVSYGSGCDALLVQVTDAVGKMRDRRRGIKKHLESKKELKSYERYLAFRNLIPLEIGIRGEEILFTQISTLWREHKGVMALVGSRCKRCGTPQYPSQRVCVIPECGACDEMEDYRFSDKKGVLFTFAVDNLAVSMDPPEKYGMVDFEEGGRFMFDITDAVPEALSIGMEVEMTFRKRETDEARGIHNYFWKAMPIRAK